MKSLVLIFLTILPLLASGQLLVVIADDFDTPKASLQRYEYGAGHYVKVGNAIAVNIGRNGLGWGIGESETMHGADEPFKREGDGKAPAGIFSLGKVFGYAPNARTAMPYLHATRDLICIDDASSPFYNTIRPVNDSVVVKSFEWMRRDDELYALGVTVGHNPQGVSEKGSCIFLHVQKSGDSPTAGCTSMTIDELRTLAGWLDPDKKPLLVQIPKSRCMQISRRFNGVTCP